MGYVIAFVLGALVGAGGASYLWYNYAAKMKAAAAAAGLK